MANDEIYVALSTLQNIYDEYFTALAKGEPIDIELPEITVDTVKNMVQEELPADLDVGVADLNGVMDAMKAGFAHIKLNKEDSRWATGFKLTSVDDTPGESDAESDDE